jgi:F0F1-type ATP synthase epsilon subunit
MDTSVFNLIILSREGIVFQNTVSSISSYNSSGYFDVLAQHANFISLIQKEIIVRNVEGIENKIPISNALIKVIQNNVKIYLGIDWFTDSKDKAPSS